MRFQFKKPSFAALLMVAVVFILEVEIILFMISSPIPLSEWHRVALNMVAISGTAIILTWFLIVKPVKQQLEIQKYGTHLNRTNARRLYSFTEAANLAFVITDMQYSTMYANPALLQLLQTSSAAVETNFIDFYAFKSKKQLTTKILPTVKTRGFWKGELELKIHTGGHVITEHNIFAIKNEQDQVVYIAFVISDISKRKSAELKLTKLAHFDSLTGLHNRALFKKALTQLLHLLKSEHAKLCVMFLDLDNFKQINDSLGHDTGDEVLKIAASRLRNNLKTQDIVARIGGDEFAIAIQCGDERQIVTSVAQRIIQAIADPIVVNGNHCPIGISIGISCYPDDGVTTEALVKAADKAMYHSKQAGRNQFTFAPGCNKTYSER